MQVLGSFMHALAGPDTWDVSCGTYSEGQCLRSTRPGFSNGEVCKNLCRSKRMWGFPKIRGTFLGVPILSIIVYGGLYWGPLI